MSGRAFVMLTCSIRVPFFLDFEMGEVGPSVGMVSDFHCFGADLGFCVGKV